MAIRNLRFEGDDLLRKKSKIVETFNDRLSQLIDDMKETMYQHKGVGLAAPQIGILKRVIVIDIGKGPLEIVNPKIISQSGTNIGPEGCLSCPYIGGIVQRPNKVILTGYNRNKNQIIINGEGLLARVICHEIDHLNGILFTDLASDLTKLNNN